MSLELAQSYKVAFDNTKAGREVLDDLAKRFGGNPYKRGGLEAQRETDFRAGQLSVLNRILRMLDIADNPALLTQGDQDGSN